MDLTDQEVKTLQQACRRLSARKMAQRVEVFMLLLLAGAMIYLATFPLGVDVSSEAPEFQALLEADPSYQIMRESLKMTKTMLLAFFGLAMLQVCGDLLVDRIQNRADALLVKFYEEIRR